MLKALIYRNLPQPHVVRDPSRQARATASVTAALQIAWAKATSFDPVDHTNK